MSSCVIRGRGIGPVTAFVKGFKWWLSDTSTGATSVQYRQQQELNERSCGGWWYSRLMRRERDVRADPTDPWLKPSCMEIALFVSLKFSLYEYLC